ncbi:MAG: lytic transglycosylase domain-containing protein [Bacteroidota bacterium]|nr:lytic transglycosylase domain-containing protein [Bacteroidota bacterium]
MLKTQLSKAIYLMLLCLAAVSFIPRQQAGANFSTSNEGSPAIVANEATANNKLLLAPHVELNKQELQFAKKYIKTSIEDLDQIKQRSKVPFTIIDSVFGRYGLPLQLKYLAVIESELKSSALSCVGALGPWQLMPETAHDLGLKVSRQNDERTNYYKSTKAAALYLKDLYAQFGDWLLVLAAYNGGPGKVLTAIHKSGSRNFWALQSYLPAESREHVKRFIATHYYFEGQGSVTTLTKAENIQFAKSVKAFEANSVCAIAVKTGVVHNLLDINDYSANQAPKKSEKPSSSQEPAEDRFKKLMKTSEESLQKANKLIEG